MLVHFTGICGTAMAGVAAMLRELGFHVQGSDVSPYPPMSTFLEAQGISILPGYNARNLTNRPAILVVGNVARKDNPEVLEAQRLGIQLMSMPQVLEEYFLQDKASVVIAGTHGKTTTTSLISWVLTVAGLSPSFLVGGIPLNFGRNFNLGEGRYFVIEGDEYDTAFFDKRAKFFHYRPFHAVLTSLELDHVDIYPDLAALQNTFAEFSSLVSARGTLTWCADYPGLSAVVANCKARCLSYGFSQEADLRIIETLADREGTFFSVRDRATGREQGLHIHLWGRHNVLNATAAFAVGRAIGISPAVIREALDSFKGVQRRFQILAETGGVTIVDDFAHHPTAVRETLGAAMARFPGRRILAAFHFESNSSRRKVFEKDYAAAFVGANTVFLTYPLIKNDSLKAEEYLDPDSVLAGIRQYAAAHAYKDMTVMGRAVAAMLRPGDVVVAMSGRDFSQFHSALLSAVSSTTPAAFPRSHL